MGMTYEKAEDLLKTLPQNEKEKLLVEWVRDGKCDKKLPPVHERIIIWAKEKQ